MKRDRKRGRNPIKRSKLAGSRFKEAVTILSKSLDGILDDPRWTEKVNIHDIKTLRIWIRDGMPENRIGAVAGYFGISRVYFTDPKIPEDQFEQAILKVFEQSDGPNGKGYIVPPISSTLATATPSLNFHALKEHASHWFYQGCSYQALEIISKKLEVDPYNTTPVLEQNDSSLSLFMLGCALHIGKNWAFWVKHLRNDERACHFLIDVINASLYVRPRLRALYALEKFPTDWVQASLKDGSNPELRRVIQTYILNGDCVTYFLQQKEHFPQKVNEVLKELIALWGEKIPGFGLFGTAEKKQLPKPAGTQSDEFVHPQTIRSVVIGETTAIMEKAQRYLFGKSSIEELRASTPLLTSIASEIAYLPQNEYILYRRAVTLDMELRNSGNTEKAAEVIKVCQEALAILSSPS